MLGVPTIDRRAGVGLLFAALPALSIIAVVVADLLVGPSVVLGLIVVAPLLASNVAGPVTTGSYGVAAFVVAVVLGVHDDAYRSGDALTAQLIRLGAIVAMTVTGALMARNRLRRESRLARMTAVVEVAQRAILPITPARLGPARIAVHYESATSDALVGGDLYATALTPHGLRILVGDVRGKGLDAVRLAAQVLSAFRERADDDGDLGVLLNHLDRAVTRSAAEEDFVTAVVAELGDDGTLTTAVAGHPPPLLSGGGRVRALEPRDPRVPLGLGRGGSGTTSPVTLDPGDRLLLYTDGLTEARDPRTRSFLPPEVITRALTTEAFVVEDSLAALRDDAVDWTRGTLHDDIALVLVEYAPAAGRAGTFTSERTSSLTS